MLVSNNNNLITTIVDSNLCCTVWVKCGICSADSVINILLCVLGYVPGLLHAWYIIAKYPEPDYYDYERVGDRERGNGWATGGRVTYVVVHNDDDEEGSARRQTTPRPAAGRGQPKPPGRHVNMSYGATHDNNNPPAHAPAPHHPVPGGYHGDGGAGPSDGAPPPSYAQVVADNKIQDQS